MIYLYIDVSQKQEFIYKHNKLRDNLYNSFVIKVLTEQIELPKLKEQPDLSLSQFIQQFSGDTDLIQFVYSGGGNSILLFHTQDKSIVEEFIRHYSKAVLERYPDLELYISMVEEAEIEASEPKDKQIRKKLIERSDRQKDSRRIKYKRWTYGVEEIDETGQAKLVKQVKQSNKLSKQYLHEKIASQLSGTDIVVTDLLEDYKDREEKSYIGVIAIDGNRMGEMFNSLTTFDDMNKFSIGIEGMYEEALISSLKELVHVSADNHGDESDKSNTEASKRTVYVTPVVLSGDDICLIIHAEYAIELAAKIIGKLGEISLQNQAFKPYLQNNEPLTACAGVAIVKAGYPFFEAIKEAERLCYQAKASMHLVNEGVANASFIDWTIVQGAVIANQEHERFVKHGNYTERFHVKPLQVDQDQPLKDGIYGYASFMDLVKKIQGDDSVSRSFLQELRKMVYSGWDSYKLFFEMKQTKAGDEVVKIISDLYGEDFCEFGAINEQIEGKSRVTYILNDVIDTIGFIRDGSADA